MPFRRSHRSDSRTGLSSRGRDAAAPRRRDRRRIAANASFPTPKDSDMKTAAWGIDLGTTNSCIARATATDVTVVHIDEAPTVPSVLAWDGTEFLVGRRAANHAVIAPYVDVDLSVALGAAMQSALDH